MSDADRHPRPPSPSELERWAASRAPELLERAEAEAVTRIRDALIAATLGPAPGVRAVGPGSARAPERHAPPPARGPDLLWAYCVMRAEDRGAVEAPAVAGGSVGSIVAGDLAVLVSPVPAGQFGEGPLTRNLNDLAWLERVARAHESVLDAALALGTIVPLRMCTIFESERGAAEMLERRQASLREALEALDGRLEWAVKVLVDSDRLLEAAAPAQDDPAAAARSGEGGAYLQRRRDERGIREAAGRLAADTAQQIHARLQDWALDARTSPPQNRELSGHEGEMVLNAAYLIERERTEELRGIIAELEEHHRDLGARIELSGPWPPFNFVPGGEAAGLA